MISMNFGSSNEEDNAPDGACTISCLFECNHRSDIAPSAPVMSIIDQVTDWIEACNRLHKDACIPNGVDERPAEDVPRWLIDVDDHCIVPGISAHRYLALSYVWPETRDASVCIFAPPRTLLLDHSTLEAMQRPGYLDHESIAQTIPRVIWHAISFTRSLKERYLWVDRLCIVQNDSSDGGTLSQVANMDKLYAGAYLTVIAAAPDDLYETNSPAEWSMFESTKNRFQRIWTPGEYFPVRETETPRMKARSIARATRARYHALTQSRWATRGWTYQEQILCKRAVVFAEKGIFWDCHCAVWDGVDLRPEHDFSRVDLRADLGQRFYTRWWPDFGFYIDLVCPYNGRDFSYPQDALLGILGVLNALEKSFSGGFICGLPRLFLDHALIWQPFGITNRRMDRIDDGTPLSSLPSWSWCGWQCYIDPWSLRSGMSYSYEPAYQKRACSWQTRNLVEWKVICENKEPISEPLTLDRYVEMATDPDAIAPADWKRLYVLDACGEVETSLFRHALDKKLYFRHPLPLKRDSHEGKIMHYSQYLACDTTHTVSLIPAAVLRFTNESSEIYLGPSKISVFEQEAFLRGPSSQKACPILILQQPNGAFAGLLRLMDKDAITGSTSCELIAISKGSADSNDLRCSLEWQHFETGSYCYSRSTTYSDTFYFEPLLMRPDGVYALYTDITETFGRNAARNPPQRDLIDAIADSTDRIACVDDEDEQRTAETSLRSERTKIVPAGRKNWFDARRDFFYGNPHGKDVDDVHISEDDNIHYMDDVLSVGSTSAIDSYGNSNDAHIDNTGRQGGDNHIDNGHHIEARRYRDTPPGEDDHDVLIEDSIRETRENEDDITVCEFYNVLWIERKDGIAYRRACGWVPKFIWEAHATEYVNVTLS